MKFRGEYHFLSNFYPAAITVPVPTKGGVRSVTFPTVENAFQAMKCPDRYQDFVDGSPYQAKKLGRKIPLRPDWESVKDGIMEQLLRHKFTQHPALKERLCEVSGPIVEENEWGDRYWGVCAGIGENRLGKLLMGLRDEYRDEY